MHHLVLRRSPCQRRRSIRPRPCRQTRPRRYCRAIAASGSSLALRFGLQRVLYLKSVGEGSEASEIWLGMDLHGLPRKVCYTDRNGESFVQLADELEFDDNEPAETGKLPEPGR